MTICNVYIPDSQNLNSTELSNLINQLPSPFLLLGDFNARNIIWGSKTTDSRGKTLETLLTTSDIAILNTGESTHFCAASGSFSSIDLTFSSPCLLPSLEWQVIPDLYDSDHFPLIVSSLNKKPQTILPGKWKIRNANWESFSDSVAQKISTFEITENIDTIINSFNNIIIDSANLFVGKTKSQLPRHCPVPWWNDTCEDIVKRSKQALNKLRKHRSEENIINFKKLRALARKTIKEHKKESWKKYVSSLTNQTPTREVWEKIGRIKGRNSSCHIEALLDETGNTVTANKDMSNLMAKALHGFSSNRNYSPQFIHFKNMAEKEKFPNNTDRSSNPINLPITKTELLEALKTTRNSAGGPDDIPAIFLKHLPPNAIDKLLDIYNTIWNKKTFPAVWKQATVIPIHKPGKNKMDVSGYRPISLTCTSCKVLEKIVNKRLLWFLESNQLLSNSQGGFRPNRSTTDNLVHFHSEIMDSFDNQQDLLAIFFDIRRAFDTTWRHNIMKKLMEFQLDGNVFYFIEHFLQDRTFKVLLNGTPSNALTLENGVPQGSVLSTTLFIIAIDDVTKIIKKPVQTSLYADDLLLYCRGKNITSVRDILQDTLNDLQEWTNKTGFVFSTEKTKIMHFSRKHLPAIFQPLYLDNTPLSVVSEHRFLGMVFDSKLNWNSHLQHLKTECFKRINILKALSHISWGSDETILLTLYKSLIRSKLDYGSIIYASASKSSLGNLNVIQNTALRLVTGAFRTSPAVSLYRETGELPLWMRRKQLSLAYASKVAALPNHPVYKILTKSFTTNATSRTLLPFHKAVRDHFPYPLIQNTRHVQPNKTPPWCLNLPTADISMTAYNKSEVPQTRMNSLFNININRHRSDIIVYTDASKSSEAVGCSVILPDTSLQYKLPPVYSIFSGELYSIWQAINYIKATQYKEIIISTDSLSSIIAIQQIYSTAPIIQDIQATISNLIAAGKEITFFWTPSHCGIPGNCLADRLAREACQREEVVNAPLFHKDLRVSLKHRIQSQWHQIWQQQHTSLGDIDRSIIRKTIPGISRRELVILRRLRIGHTSLTHLHYLLNDEPPVCETCREQLNVEHFLIKCPKYEKARQDFQIDGRLPEILNMETAEQINDLLSFLKCTNIYRLI